MDRNLFIPGNGSAKRFVLEDEEDECEDEGREGITVRGWSPLLSKDDQFD